MGLDMSILTARIQQASRNNLGPLTLKYAWPIDEKDQLEMATVGLFLKVYDPVRSMLGLIQNFLGTGK